MKTFFLQISLLLAGSFSFAGGVTIGNGGTGVICHAQTPSKEIKIEMLEYYELSLTGVPLKLNANLNNYKDIITENLNRWKSVAPARVELYENWLQDFEKESLFVANSYFPPVNDTGTIAVPFGCELQTLAFQRAEEDLFPGVKRYTINSDYWKLMNPIQQAGLVMHELIYREGIALEHKNSFPTRYFNSYLASAEPNAIDYAYVVSQLPLKWVEFGGGLSVWALIYDIDGKLYKNQCVQKNGFAQSCPFGKIIGDINTSQLSIEFCNLSKQNEIYGEITLQQDYFSLSFNELVCIRSLTFRGTQGTHQYLDTKNVTRIYFDREKQKLILE